MKTFKYVILGSGVVAGYAAQEFVQQKGGNGELAIVTADETIPYDRPPLSKHFLAGKATRADILINALSFYLENGIEVLTRHCVAEVDFEGKILRCQPGEDIRYEKLLIATGSLVRMFKGPGADLDGIYYLRLRRDAEAIRSRIKKNARAVVIGSGFIGMEVSSVLARAGVHTTMAFRGERIWQNFFTPEMSDFFKNYYEQRGVVLLPHAEIEAFHGTKKVEAVELKSGERLPADFVVAGIGVEPATSLFRRNVKGAIMVNEFLETSIPDVWAAGDVVNFPDKVFDKRRHIEHWDNAVEQGRVALRNMMGRPQPFIHVSYFFSDEFDLSWEFWGDTENYDRVVYRGEVAQGQFSTWWLKEGRVMGAFVLNRPNEERELAPKWIMHRRVLDPEILGDNARSLRDLDAELKGIVEPEAMFV